MEERLPSWGRLEELTIFLAHLAKALKDLAL
jgi:hypothetical protein